MYDLRVWPNVDADGNYKTTTPGKGKDSGKNNQMQRFGKLYKEYCNGQIPKVSERLVSCDIKKMKRVFLPTPTNVL